VLFAVVLLAAAWLSDVAGKSGLYAVALVSGLTDVDALTLSSLQLFTSAKLGAREAVVAIALALLANTAFKLGLVLTVGRCRWRAASFQPSPGAGRGRGDFATGG
jgi:uncharacterized membrane protein (DUF4010 family)